MHLLRCIFAEWQLVRARLVRSRLGLWLLLLGAGQVWLSGRAGGDLSSLALEVGMLGAVLCVAFGAGSDADRASLALTLTHPTTPIAFACGRWLAAVTAATIVMLSCLVAAAGANRVGGVPLARAALAGTGAAGAVAACTLLAVWGGGNALAGVLFLYIALGSSFSPDDLRRLFGPGPLVSLGAVILDVAPSVWRYRQLANGEPNAWLHAFVWTVAGVPLAGEVARKRVR